MAAVSRKERIQARRDEAHARRDAQQADALAEAALSPDELTQRIAEAQAAIRHLEHRKPQCRTVVQPVVLLCRDVPCGTVVRHTPERVLTATEEAKLKDLRQQIHRLEKRISHYKDLLDPSRVERRKKQLRTHPQAHLYRRSPDYWTGGQPVAPVQYNP